jgi:hypothetical protein
MKLTYILDSFLHFHRLQVCFHVNAYFPRLIVVNLIMNEVTAYERHVNRDFWRVLVSADGGRMMSSLGSGVMAGHVPVV